MFLLHGLKKPDIIFFVICGIIILLIIAIYFLIPVFKRKQFAESRENLKRREILFRENQKNEQPEEIKVEAVEVEATVEEVEAPVEKVADNE